MKRTTTWAAFYSVASMNSRMACIPSQAFRFAITPGFTFLSLVKQRGYIGFGRWALDADLERKHYSAARLVPMGGRA